MKTPPWIRRLPVTSPPHLLSHPFLYDDPGVQSFVTRAILLDSPEALAAGCRGGIRSVRHPTDRRFQTPKETFEYDQATEMAITGMARTKIMLAYVFTLFPPIESIFAASALAFDNRISIALPSDISL